MSSPSHFAVLGGGVSGLSTAWYLSKLAPKTARITVVEKNARVGGWVHTNMQDGQLYELGPRTIRPVGVAGRAVLDMVYRLNLVEEVLTTPKNSPAAINRYIYQNSRLHHLPTSPLDLLMPWKAKSPLLKGLLFSVLREPFVKPTNASDESIHGFVERRFGRALADNLVSAVIHGIYAGDSTQLSVRSAMPFLWECEKKHGSVGRGVLAPPAVAPIGDERAPLSVESNDAKKFISDIQRNSSIFSFKNGMQTLTDALKRDLDKEENVSFIRGNIESLSFKEGVEIAHTASSQPLKADHVISAIPAVDLSRILPPSSHALSSLLSSIKSVDVAVVNISFGGHFSKILPVNGFGYLVPATEDTPILGTVFDSCAMPKQDSGDQTRVTVMMGGHKFHKYFGDPDVVSKEKLLETAMTAVRTHLGVNAEPIASSVVIHKQCIPQYVVGHRDRLHAIHEEVKSQHIQLSLVGASYLGVAVNDCVKGARDLVSNLLVETQAKQRRITGLERIET
ncbi:protoporphyrinogen oxidase [Spizellomyces punctatus DAOM BR117]|uniref:Protoporphyrinogen oxidase n=1 Tax=Spizellomyces punctatus (strain DAOM BR117) TaxID=645134 RepID=A0A0L0HNM1_SPIPD|nr:protoporphyrinogen oxidase [Spizellomyces punctatus DAOM BR117]KND02545.1 protoporphyrinogen oxidase [Spizellomyces punctatus DAOM BR117]|eukprot:XP_016610584.1 protoporphyrinogen oxidase [Spizellomyces punctatus DAOM BR117]